MGCAWTGSNPDKPTWVAIKGTIFDVSNNKAYKEKGNYAGAIYHSPSLSSSLVSSWRARPTG